MDGARGTSAVADVSDRLEYDSASGTYRLPFDGQSEPASTAVVEAVATVAETDPMAMEPLYSTVDPDALDELIASETTGQASCDVHVSFRLDDHEVTVRSDGVVAVEPIEEGG